MKRSKLTSALKCQGVSKDTISVNEYTIDLDKRSDEYMRKEFIISIKALIAKRLVVNRNWRMKLSIANSSLRLKTCRKVMSMPESALTMVDVNFLRRECEFLRKDNIVLKKILDDITQHTIESDNAPVNDLSENEKANKAININNSTTYFQRLCAGGIENVPTSIIHKYTTNVSGNFQKIDSLLNVSLYNDDENDNEIVLLPGDIDNHNQHDENDAMSLGSITSYDSKIDGNYKLRTADSSPWRNFDISSVTPVPRESKGLLKQRKMAVDFFSNLLAVVGSPDKGHSEQQKQQQQQ